MRKMKLDLETLGVQSFETEGVPEGKGTVHGHGSVGCSQDPDNTCGQYTCGADHSCIGQTCTGCGTAWKCTLYETDDCTFYCGTGGTSCWPSDTI